MTHVLLIQPPIRDFYLTAKRTQPYGLSRIGAHLIRAGFCVELLDALSSQKARPLPWPAEMGYLEPFYGNQDISPFSLFHRYYHFGHSYAHLGNLIEKSGAFLVGISALFTPYADTALQTAEMVKRRLPKARVVMGGHHPTAMPEAVMANPAVDFVIRGPGEKAMVRLAVALKKGGGLEDVPGIVFRKKEGLFISGPETADRSVSRLLPALHLVRRKAYARKKKDAVIISASRGCPMTCSYCCLAKNRFWPHARRKVADVLAEIHHAASHLDLGFIDFEDENLTLDRKWFMDLMEGISRRFGENGPELRAMNGLYPAALDEAVLRAMKRAGFSSLNLSLGALSSEQLHRFCRRNMVREFDRAVDLARSLGMDAVGYVVVGAPGQTAKSSLDDLAYLAQRPVLAAASVYYPAPMSRDFDTCRQNGLLPEKLSLYRSSALPVSHAASRLEIATLLRLFRLVGFVKRLLARNIPLPPPVPFEGAPFPRPEDRMEAGLALLSFFRHDGVIRGMTPQGRIYPHPASTELVKAFREKIPLSRA